jgi:hypothetical protein
MNVLQTFLKRYAEINWNSKAIKIKSLYLQLTEVCKVLDDIVKNVLENPETTPTA